MVYLDFPLASERGEKAIKTDEKKIRRFKSLSKAR